eukprot:scaffold42965_cov75-Phaeocystis_antarctica.AAC.2
MRAIASHGVRPTDPGASRDPNVSPSRRSASCQRSLSVCVLVLVVPHVASLLRPRPALEPRVLRLLGEHEDAAHRRAVHAADEEGDHGGGARHGDEEEGEAGGEAHLVFPDHRDEREAEGDERGAEAEGEVHHDLPDPAHHRDPRLLVPPATHAEHHVPEGHALREVLAALVRVPEALPHLLDAVARPDAHRRLGLAHQVVPCLRLEVEDRACPREPILGVWYHRLLRAAREPEVDLVEGALGAHELLLCHLHVLGEDRLVHELGVPLLLFDGGPVGRARHEEGVHSQNPPDEKAKALGAGLRDEPTHGRG